MFKIFTHVGSPIVNWNVSGNILFLIFCVLHILGHMKPERWHHLPRGAWGHPVSVRKELNESTCFPLVLRLYLSTQLRYNSGRKNKILRVFFYITALNPSHILIKLGYLKLSAHVLLYYMQICGRAGVPNPQAVDHYWALSPSESGCGSGGWAWMHICICASSGQEWVCMLHLCKQQASIGMLGPFVQEVGVHICHSWYSAHMCAYLSLTQNHPLSHPPSPS